MLDPYPIVLAPLNSERYIVLWIKLSSSISLPTLSLVTSLNVLPKLNSCE